MSLKFWKRENKANLEKILNEEKAKKKIAPNLAKKHKPTDPRGKVRPEHDKPKEFCIHSSYSHMSKV